MNLSEPGAAERLVADPILVLAADGTVPVPRSVFVDHVAQRQVAATGSRTVLRDIAGPESGMPGAALFLPLDVATPVPVVMRTSTTFDTRRAGPSSSG